MSDTEQNPTTNKSWVSKYRERTTDIDKSFHDFVLENLNLNVKATDSLRLPHYSGVVQNFPLPLTEYYCEHALLIYKPWTKMLPISTNGGLTYIQQFLRFVKSSNCPPELLLTYERAKTPVDSLNF